MVQLGPSLDAVYLKVISEGWRSCVMIESGQGLHQYLAMKGALMKALAGTLCRAFSEDDKSVHLVIELCSGGGIQDWPSSLGVEPGQGLQVGTWQ